MMKKERTIKKIAGNVDLCCPKCHAEALRVQTYSDTVDFRGLELDVEGLHITICDSCRHSFHSKAQIEHNFERARLAYAVARDRLRVRDGLLSSSEIAQIRESLGLKQREAATLFGGGPNAFNKYESGEVLQSVPMDRLLRLARGVGEFSVQLLQSVVRDRQLGIPRKEVYFIPPVHPSVLHVFDGNIAVKLVQQNSIGKIMSVIENTSFRGEASIEGRSSSGSSASFYLKPSQNTSTKLFVEK